MYDDDAEIKESVLRKARTYLVREKNETLVFNEHNHLVWVSEGPNLTFKLVLEPSPLGGAGICTIYGLPHYQGPDTAWDLVDLVPLEKGVNMAEFMFDMCTHIRGLQNEGLRR